MFALAPAAAWSAGQSGTGERTGLVPGARMADVTAVVIAAVVSLTVHLRRTASSS